MTKNGSVRIICERAVFSFFSGLLNIATQVIEKGGADIYTK